MKDVTKRLDDHRDGICYPNVGGLLFVTCLKHYSYQLHSCL
jgi:hypothetical protein